MFDKILNCSLVVILAGFLAVAVHYCYFQPKTNEQQIRKEATEYGYKMGLAKANKIKGR